MSRLYRWGRRHVTALSWGVSGLAVVVTLSLGWLGFSEWRPEFPFSTRLYLALQLLTLESGAIEAFEQARVPWSLQVARWAGAFAALSAIVNTLLAVFADRIQRFALRRRSGHAVVIGAGRVGSQLTTDLLDDGRRVTVIEPDAASPALATLVERGADAVVGDARDLEILAAAAVHRADVAVVVAGRDTANLEILDALHAASGKRGSDARPLQCHVHLAHGRLDRLADRPPATPSAENAAQLEVAPFCRFSNAARLLLDEVPLDREGIAPGDERRVHLVIIDLSPLGEALLRQALSIGHYANDRPLAVTVIDEAASRKEQGLLVRMPELHECADLTFLDGYVEHEAIRKQLAGLLNDSRQLVSVAVCRENPEAALTTCLDLLPLLTDGNDTLYVNLAEDERVASLLAAAPLGSGRLVPFGESRSSCSAHAVLRWDLDVLARRIHEEYRAKRIRDGDSEEKYPAMRPWTELAGDLRDSNRQQADHIPVKLRALSCRMVPAPDEADDGTLVLKDEEIEALARAEHRRWCASRRLAGYRYGPTRNDAARIHPDLVPWEELSEPIRDYDREPVRNLPTLLATLGYRIERQRD